MGDLLGSRPGFSVIGDRSGRCFKSGDELLPDDSAKTLTIATGLGAASSSCSYAGVALARSIFRKGADFTAAMVFELASTKFELASTNLVAELAIIMLVLLGWQIAAPSGSRKKT